MFIFLEHDDARALAHDEAVAVLVIGAARLFGAVVIAHVERARLREAGDADQADRRLGAARAHDVRAVALGFGRSVCRERGVSEVLFRVATSPFKKKNKYT